MRAVRSRSSTRCRWESSTTPSRRDIGRSRSSSRCRSAPPARSATKSGSMVFAPGTVGRRSWPVTSCARSTHAFARSRRRAAARSPACPKAATARSTSHSTIPTSSPWSNRGRGTSGPTGSVPSSGRTYGRSPRTIPVSCFRGSRRRCGSSGRTSGSTRARRIRCTSRTPRSRVSSRARESLTGISRCTAVTTGRSGGTTRGLRISLPRRGLPMRSAARSTAASLLAVGVLLAATGWLYVARPAVSMPGPMVHDALALDELSQHGSVSIWLYLLVWGGAASLLGLLARWARAERLTAGMLLGPAVAAWLYAANGVSILVVRQIPAHQAFQAAAAEQAVVLPAVLAGVAGALLGRARTVDRPRARVVLSWLVAGVGLLAALDGMFPEHRRSLVVALDAAHVHGLSKALVVPLALGLMVTARGLVRGSSRAWQLAITLLTVLLVLHLERGFDDGAIVTGLAVVALLARRADFRLRGDPSSKPRIAVHAAVLASAVGLYGLITLWVNRLM